MAEFIFEYVLGTWGWADVTLGNGQAVATCAASYLAEPFRDIARLACYLLEPLDEDGLRYDPPEPQVSFVGEPDGLLLRVTVPDGERDSETSLGFAVSRLTSCIREEEKELLFAGSTTVVQFCDVVYNQLDGTLRTHGFAGYYDRWLNSQFPLVEYARLAHFLGHKELTIPLPRLTSLEEEI